jgi:hypothetical protein
LVRYAENDHFAILDTTASTGDGILIFIPNTITPAHPRDAKLKRKTLKNTL